MTVPASDVSVVTGVTQAKGDDATMKLQMNLSTVVIDGF